MGNINITDSEGPLVLPPLKQGQRLVVTSSLTQLLNARGVFSRLPFEDAHDHIAKLRSVCYSCVGRQDLDMDVIGLKLFPLSLMGEGIIWFTKFSYNLIYTSDKFRDMFLARYYLVSKNLNHNSRGKNFVALPVGVSE